MSTPPLLLTAHPAGVWQLRTLGTVAASNGDIPLPPLPSRAVTALLVRLAVFAGRDHAREELCELLWPGAPPHAARNRLRNALSTLNRLLALPGQPGPVVLADRRALRLPPGRVVCDAEQFESHLRAGRTAQARACWGGEFMPGYYDEWIHQERLRLQALHDRLAAPAPASPPMPAPVAETAAACWRQVPHHDNAFFGRDTEMQALASGLREHRLVWITGPSGCGKSRLAAEFGGRAAGFDAVVWVSMLALPSLDHALEQVRAALGLHTAPLLPLEQIAARLHGLNALLILDNLEHLLDGTRTVPVVRQLLERLPRLAIAATTQHLPRSPAGQRLALAPLAVPAPADASADASAAVQLFVSRARQRRGDFSLHPGNRADIVAVCRALHGLPLAIELAATRVRELSAAEMRAAMQAGAWPALKVAGRHRDARHASLHAAIAWSWRLLSPAQQRLLAALSVQRGGIDASDAAGLGRVPVARCADALAELEAVSMLQAAAAAASQPTRWVLLDAPRRFAQAQLDTRAAQALRRRHGEHWLAKAQALAAAHRRIGDDAQPDVLHAVESSVADGLPSLGAELLLATRAQWVARGAGARVLALFGTVAAAPRLPRRLGARLLALLAQLRVEAGQGEAAMAAAAQAVSGLVASRGDRAGARAVRLEVELAAVQVRWRVTRDGTAALPAAQALLARAEVHGEALLVGRAAMLCGAITSSHASDQAAAEALFLRARRAFADAGDAQADLTVLPGYTACLLQQRHRLKDALALAAEGAEQAHRLGDVHNELLLLNRVGESAARLQRHAQALVAGQRQAALAQRQGMAYHLAYALWNQCHSLARVGQAERAVRLMAFSARWWAADFAPLQREDERYIARVRAAALRHLDGARWASLWAQGERLPPAQGIALGLGDGGGAGAFND